MTEVLIDSVFQAYGKQEILRGASLRLKQGQVIGLLGRNGCGKSTLLKILIGEQTADNAYIGVDGSHCLHLYQIPGLINYLPQHPCHPVRLSLHRLVKLYGISPPEFFTENADFFPNPEIRLRELSGGHARLFEVLLVLAAPARFTLLDEPFSHLMPIHVNTIKKRIETVGKNRGILITDHQYQHVLDASDKLYLLHSGTTTIIEEVDELVRLGYLRELE